MILVFFSFCTFGLLCASNLFLILIINTEPFQSSSDPRGHEEVWKKKIEVHLVQLFRTHVPRTSHYRTPNANLTCAVSLCSQGCIWLTFLEPEHSTKQNTSNVSLFWLRDDESTVLTIWWIIGKDWDECNLHAWYSFPVPDIFSFYL